VQSSIRISYLLTSIKGFLKGDFPFIGTKKKKGGEWKKFHRKKLKDNK
jgi:hypothetical protein